MQRYTAVVDFMRKCPVIEVNASLFGERVARVLEQFACTHGPPECIVCDNGSEVGSQALDQQAHDRGVMLHFIEPGKPVQNCYIKSFSGKLRDECLNES
jgi:putative transposase